ncbi:MAG TPA: type II toxin-antitoxin system VapC family toxin [Fimbriimonas sp.]|nr:type II toxin-antitoxin system VapC family toxin [Fimbriimonas sp.]
MTYLLDANVIIGILNERPPILRKRFAKVIAGGDSILTSSVVMHELWFGVFKSAKVRANSDLLRSFRSGPIEVLDVQEEDAVLAGELRANLKIDGTPIGPYDLLIAAQAIRSDTTLVTSNTREFSRLPDLKLVDWTLAS